MAVVGFRDLALGGDIRWSPVSAVTEPRAGGGLSMNLQHGLGAQRPAGEEAPPCGTGAAASSNHCSDERRPGLPLLSGILKGR